MSELRDEAEAFARALEYGLCDPAEVVAWADARLLREDRPPLALCEASLARDSHPLDVAGVLRRCPGTPDGPETAKLLAALLKERLRIDVDRTMYEAYLMANDGALRDAPGLERVAWWTREALALSDDGYIEETRDEIVRVMSEALHEAAGDVAWPPGLPSA